MEDEDLEDLEEFGGVVGEQSSYGVLSNLKYFNFYDL